MKGQGGRKIKTGEKGSSNQRTERNLPRSHSKEMLSDYEQKILLAQNSLNENCHKE